MSGTYQLYGSPSVSSVLTAISAQNTGSASTGISVNTTGVSGTNANLPPYLSINFIIKV
jgi:microcystin-dependent protein